MQMTMGYPPQAPAWVKNDQSVLTMRRWMGKLQLVGQFGLRARLASAPFERGVFLVAGWALSRYVPFGRTLWVSGGRLLPSRLLRQNLGRRRRQPDHRYGLG